MMNHISGIIHHTSYHVISVAYFFQWGRYFLPQAKLSMAPGMRRSRRPGSQLIMGRNPQTDIAPIGRNPEGKDHLPTTPTPRLIFGCLRQFQGGLMWLDHSWMIVVRHSGQWVMAVWANYFDLTRQKALVQAKLANYDSLLKLFFYRIRSFWQCMKLIIPSGNCMGSHFERSSANLIQFEKWIKTCL